MAESEGRVYHASRADYLDKTSFFNKQKLVAKTSQFNPFPPLFSQIVICDKRDSEI